MNSCDSNTEKFSPITDLVQIWQAINKLFTIEIATIKLFNNWMRVPGLDIFSCFIDEGKLRFA